MTAAEKYGRPKDLPSEALRQVEAIGETLRARGVSYDASAPLTPALKYGAPAPRQLERSLVQERSR